MGSCQSTTTGSVAAGNHHTIARVTTKTRKGKRTVRVIPIGTCPPPHRRSTKTIIRERCDKAKAAAFTDHDREQSKSPPRVFHHSSSSIIGLDEMMMEFREMGDICQNMVQFEVPLGIPIEEVYDGVHDGPTLGTGMSGIVRLVTHKATGLKYAVKILELSRIDNMKILKQMREEIVIMSQLDHPNIVRLEAVYESSSEIYLVQELCFGGELFNRLEEQPDYHYNEWECAKLIKQMVSAVRYLHRKGIIHRDLKLENFLFSTSAADSELKLIDFGLSKHFCKYGEIHKEPVGTAYTIAPEVIRGRYDERCDVWSIGVIAFLLLSGRPPFGGCGGPEAMSDIRNNILYALYDFEPKETWDEISPLARKFIRDLLRVNPRERPSAQEVQTHQWLQEYAKNPDDHVDTVLNPNVITALINFKEMSDMRKILYEALSYTLLPSQIAELRREFEKIDTDGCGEISLDAMKQRVLESNHNNNKNNNNNDCATTINIVGNQDDGATSTSFGVVLTEKDVEDIFHAMKVNKTETRIHWREFVAATCTECKVDDRNLRLAFDRLDSDHKGYIVPEDIMDLVGIEGQQMREGEIQRMWSDCINSVQCSKKTLITYNDFLHLMKEGQQWKLTTTTMNAAVPLVRRDESDVELYRNVCPVAA